MNSICREKIVRVTIRQKTASVIFCKQMGVVNWENVSQKIVKIILILINRNVCGAYIVYWMLLEYARWLLKSTKG